MITPAQIATHGLYPGWKPFHCATLGHYFYAEVILGPGGSDLEVYDIKDSRRVVTVIIHYKQHSWKQSLLVESITIDRIMKVVGQFRLLKNKTIEVAASVRASIKKVVIRATPK